MPTRKAIAILMFMALSALYIATMCPTVYTMDCGELMVAAEKLLLAHPTGYPLFCLLWKLGSLLIPFGSVAWQMNALNALMAAAAMAVLFLALSEVVRRELALFGTLLVSVSPLYWDIATSTEVHSLSTLLLSLELLLFLRWRRLGDNRLLQYLALTAGFAMTNHLSSALVLPGFLYGIIRKDPTVLRDGRFLLKSAVLFVVPLSLYAYLPLRAEASRGTIWGDLYQSTGFLPHITGAAFRTLMFSLPPDRVWGNFLKFMRLLILEFPMAVAWALPIGAIIRRQHAGLLGAFLLMIVPNIIYNINYNIHDIEPYYVPSILALSAMLVIGLQYVIIEMRRPMIAKAVAVLLPVLLVSVVAHELPRIGKQDKTTVMDHAHNMMRSLDEGALFIACSDSSYNAMLYERVLNGERPDLIVLHRNIVRAWPKDSDVWEARYYYDRLSENSPAMQQFRWSEKRYTRKGVINEEFLCDVIDQAVKERPVYITCMGMDDGTHPMLERLNSDYQLLPWGLLTRVVPKSQTINYAALSRANEQIWEQYEIRGIYGRPYRNGELEREIPERYAHAHLTLGDIELRAAMYKEAERNYRKALDIDPFFHRARKGLAVALTCQDRRREAAKEWRTVLQYQPEDEVARKGLQSGG